jgi:hypothetical protein
MPTAESVHNRDFTEERKLLFTYPYNCSGLVEHYMQAAAFTTG